jgi:hypothetical protein
MVVIMISDPQQRVDTGALPAIVHAWLAYAGIACNLATAGIEIAPSGNRARRAKSTLLGA